MQYLTVAADYTQSALRDDFEGPIDPEALGLPTDLCNELRSWNELYRKIIPLDQAERRSVYTAELIERLDEQGREIAKRVAGALKGEAKIRYYSEGRLQYITQ